MKASLILTIIIFAACQTSDSLEIKNTHADIETLSSRVVESLERSFFTNGLKVNYQALLFDPVLKKDVTLSAILGEKRTTNLIFIYNNSDCNACVKNEIRLIKKLQNAIGSIKVIAIVKERHPNYGLLFKKNMDIDIRIRQDRSKQTAQSSISILNGTLITPALLMVDGNGQIRNSFFPVKGHPDLSNAFYNYCVRVL